MTARNRKIAVLGASGYTGADAVRLLARHPHVEIDGAHRQHPCRQGDGRGVSAFLPARSAGADRMGEGRLAHARCRGLRLPHGTTQEIIAAVLRANPAIKVLDMSADFRLRDMATYAQWYGHAHRAPELQDEAVYGLTEFYRDGDRRPRGWSPVPAAIRRRRCSRWCRW